MIKKNEISKKSDEKRLCRREFLKKAAKRSAVAAGMAAAAHLPYKKPSVDSFFGIQKAYAQGTGGGFFSLSVSHVPVVGAIASQSLRTRSPFSGYVEPIFVASGSPATYTCTISKVELYNGTGWITIFTGSASKDYMIEGGWPGITMLPVPPGTYSKVQITFSYTECFSGQIEYETQTYYTTNTNSSSEYLSSNTTGPAAVGCVSWAAYPGEEVRTHDIDPVVISGPSDIIDKCYTYETTLLNMLLSLYNIASEYYFYINAFPYFGDCPNIG